LVKEMLEIVICSLLIGLVIRGLEHGKPEGEDTTFTERARDFDVSTMDLDDFFHDCQA